MPSDRADCTTCGACCFGTHDRYVAILPEDAGREIPPSALTEIDGRLFMAMRDGHCAQLTRTADNRLTCALYRHRPEACRAFRAGSFECGRARTRRLPLAEAMRCPPPDLPNALGAPSAKGPEAEPPPAHVIGPPTRGRMPPAT
ncbi:MAG: YkgJ family cysteine cluster protein [Defluviimonas sp.]|uniref:YkgJ family cysteine cluster protein n=1 Tax=Albidovulum sp. TaxID=1872424 RepID=UPI001D4C53F1|nr:YkgJ family cysteine cluster protein [Paracoccaceae bacterium]MCC0064216.1 YkgJ family cysteine cluster protein [Defluviimonas sp.]